MDEWRWMTGHSYTKLAPASGRMQLRLYFRIPTDIVGKRPTITVILNGRVLDRFVTADEYVSRDYHVEPAANGAANLAELATDAVARSAGDEKRDLGIQVRFLSWGPE